MFEGNYSKFLTVILVVVIIAIIGLLGFLGFDMYKKYYVDKEAQKAMNEFDSMVQLEDEEDDTVEGENNVDTNFVIQNYTVEDGNAITSKSKPMYKGFEMAGKIEIPKTSCNYPVLSKLSKNAIEVAVAIMCGPGLNQPGNTVIVGHNYRNGTFFSNNKKLEEGDLIYITDETGKRVQYKIYNKYTTTPEDSEYISRDTEGRREISLSTCTDDVKSRIIIWARAD